VSSLAWRGGGGGGGETKSKIGPICFYLVPQLSIPLTCCWHPNVCLFTQLVCWILESGTWTQVPTHMSICWSTDVLEWTCPKVSSCISSLGPLLCSLTYFNQCNSILSLCMPQILSCPWLLFSLMPHLRWRQIILIDSTFKIQNLTMPSISTSLVQATCTSDIGGVEALN
jgi:hypothetical protein